MKIVSIIVRTILCLIGVALIVCAVFLASPATFMVELLVGGAGGLLIAFNEELSVSLISNCCKYAPAITWMVLSSVLFVLAGVVMRVLIDTTFIWTIPVALLTGCGLICMYTARMLYKEINDNEDKS